MIDIIIIILYYFENKMLINIRGNNDYNGIFNFILNTNH